MSLTTAAVLCFVVHVGCFLVAFLTHRLKPSH